MADYSALAGKGLSFAGVDQGIDFTGAGDLYTPYGAVVTRVQSGGSGWPGEGAVINLRIIEGPAAGHYLYYAEDLVSQVKVGQRVPAGSVVARATGSGLAPGVEIGWAQPSGVPLAPRPPARPAPQFTNEGASFDRFVQAVSAVRQRSSTGGGLLGTVEHAVGSIPIIGGVLSPNDLVGAGRSAVDTAVAVPRFLGRLTDPSYILRGLQVVAGGGLVLVGVVLLARQVALAADLPDPAGLAGKTTGAVPSGTIE